MSFGTIMTILMTLLSKKDELVKIVAEAIALWNKIKILIPDLDGVINQPQVPSSATPYTITWLQESLNKLQNAGLAIDGSYGSATREAVKKFQQAHGLTADGWAGVMTQAAIIEALKGK